MCGCVYVLGVCASLCVLEGNGEENVLQRQTATSMERRIPAVCVKSVLGSLLVLQFQKAQIYQTSKAQTEGKKTKKKNAYFGIIDNNTNIPVFISGLELDPLL